MSDGWHPVDAAVRNIPIISKAIARIQLAHMKGNVVEIKSKKR